MLEFGKYILPSYETPSIQEQLQKIKECGFPIYHLIGRWYIGRKYTKKAAKFSFWIVFRLKEKGIDKF